MAKSRPELGEEKVKKSKEKKTSKDKIAKGEKKDKKEKRSKEKKERKQKELEAVVQEKLAVAGDEVDEDSEVRSF